MNKNIDKSYNALLVVRAKNANFNAGFDGNPRTLPDGNIFATDKALKYCIREYMATFGNEKIFVRRNRRLKENGKNGKVLSYETLEENYLTKLEKKEVPKDAEEILVDLKSFIDIRLFGIVFSAVKDQNISLTGPVQISYGVNKLNSSNIYPVQILSTYKNSNEKSKDANQTTIGEETRVDEVFYVYNISVNSENAKKTGMTNEDLTKLKSALLKSVDPITSCTKYGCESVALIWLNNTKNFILNNLDDFLELTKKDDEIVKMNLEKLKENLEQYGFNDVIKIEFTYDMDFIEKNENLIEVIYKKGKINV
jgi:CRISPR-associated protein Csh2